MRNMYISGTVVNVVQVFIPIIHYTVDFENNSMFLKYCRHTKLILFWWGHQSQISLNTVYDRQLTGNHKKSQVWVIYNLFHSYFVETGKNVDFLSMNSIGLTVKCNAWEDLSPYINKGMSNFWAHLCSLHGGLICVAFCLSVWTGPKIRLENNSLDQKSD